MWGITSACEVVRQEFRRRGCSMLRSCLRPSPWYQRSALLFSCRELPSVGVGAVFWTRIAHIARPNRCVNRERAQFWIVCGRQRSGAHPILSA